MGSKKRLTLKQMEKTTKKKKVQKESGSSRFAIEKRSIGIVSPDPKSGKVVDQLKKMKVLTPYTVATRLDLRLSVARSLLKELEKQGAVEFVSGSKNLKIYRPSN